MKKIIIVILCLISSGAYAQFSVDFGKSSNKPKDLNSQEFRDRFEIIGEIFVTDSSGTKLHYQADENRLWKFGTKGDILSHWSFKNPGFKQIALQHQWTLTNNGTLQVHIQQFESMTSSETKLVSTGKLLREQSFDLKDFSSINWVAFSDSNQKIIVRLTPRLGEIESMIDVNHLRIGLKNSVIFDSKARVWAEAVNVNDTFVAVTTHLGRVAFSYYPFPGGKEIGYVEGNQIMLVLGSNYVGKNDGVQKIFPDKDGIYVSIKSEKNILGSEGRMKVYGLIDFSKKTERFNSVNISRSSQKDMFLD